MLDKCRFKLDLHVLDNNKGFFLIIFSKKRGFGGGGRGEDEIVRVVLTLIFFRIVH